MKNEKFDVIMIINEYYMSYEMCEEKEIYFYRLSHQKNIQRKKMTFCFIFFRNSIFLTPIENIIAFD